MWKTIKRIFGVTDKNVDRIGYWGSFFEWAYRVFVSGSVVMTALGAFWERIASEGWAAVIIFGIASACVVTLALSLAAIAWRIVWPSVPYSGANLDDALTAPKVSSTLKADQPSSGEPEKKVDPAIYDRLMDFAVEHLLPTCDILITLNRRMIFKRFDNNTIRGLIDVGFWQYDRATFFERVRGLQNDIIGHQKIDYGRLVIDVRDIVNSYGSVIALHNEMEKTCDIVLMRDLPAEWQEWRDRHHAMVAAFEPLRKRSEIPELYSPARPPHWGDVP